MSNYEFDLPRIIEHLRVLVRRANKQSLSSHTGIPYTRLIYFARSANSTPNPGDINALAKHYLPGYTFSVPIARQVVKAPDVLTPEAAIVAAE